MKERRILSMYKPLRRGPDLACAESSHSPSRSLRRRTDVDNHGQLFICEDLHKFIEKIIGNDSNDNRVDLRL
jgi:hypothetical protein